VLFQDHLIALYFEDYLTSESRTSLNCGAGGD